MKSQIILNEGILYLDHLDEVIHVLAEQEILAVISQKRDKYLLSICSKVKNPDYSYPYWSDMVQREIDSVKDGYALAREYFDTYK